MSPGLLARVRWSNVAIAVLVMGLLALLVAWPRLSPHDPALPPAIGPQNAVPANPAATPAPSRDADSSAVDGPPPTDDITEADLRAPRDPPAQGRRHRRSRPKHRRSAPTADGRRRKRPSRTPAATPTPTPAPKPHATPRPRPREFGGFEG
jgi:hypothetical protein